MRPCLQAALVLVGARVADVLAPVGLGEEQPQTDAARGIGAAASTPLARAIALPRSATSLNGVSEFCAFSGGACMERNSAAYSSISGSMSASK